MYLPRIPTPYTSDPAWWMDLKDWCGDVVRALQYNQLRGDNITTQVSNGVVSALPDYTVPFTVRVTGPNSIAVHVGYWKRNNNYVTLTCDVGEGYKTLSGIGDGTLYVVVTLTSSGHAATDPSELTASVTASLPYPDRFNLTMPIALLSLSGGRFVLRPIQLWQGNIGDTCDIADSYDDGVVTVTGSSIGYNAANALQLYGWETATTESSIVHDSDLIPFQDADDTRKMKYITPDKLVSDVLDGGEVDPGDYLTDGYSSVLEHQIPLSSGGYVSVRFEYGRAFLFY